MILVAEDNTQVREIVTATLSDFGYTVIEAFDGEDAVEKFNEHKAEVNLLLLDVIMPRKNGKETYKEIKKARPDIRAIFMSGYTGDILSQEGDRPREGIPMISKPIVVESSQGNQGGPRQPAFSAFHPVSVKTQKRGDGRPSSGLPSVSPHNEHGRSLDLPRPEATRASFA